MEGSEDIRRSLCVTVGATRENESLRMRSMRLYEIVCRSFDASRPLLEHPETKAIPGKLPYFTLVSKDPVVAINYVFQYRTQIWSSRE